MISQFPKQFQICTFNVLFPLQLIFKRNTLSHLLIRVSFVAHSAEEIFGLGISKSEYAISASKLGFNAFAGV
jgi:hypothetical protein